MRPWHVSLTMRCCGAHCFLSILTMEFIRDRRTFGMTPISSQVLFSLLSSKNVTSLPDSRIHSASALYPGSRARKACKCNQGSYSRHEFIVQIWGSTTVSQNPVDSRYWLEAALVIQICLPKDFKFIARNCKAKTRTSNSSWISSSVRGFCLHV
jgi:hypothetical protein